MQQRVFLGEFEQLVLLVVLQSGDDAYALPVLKELSRVARRRVSRGALYRTLDRLENKGYIEWEIEREAPRRGGHPRRRFSVTDTGVRALRSSRSALLELWNGVEEVLE